MTVWVTQSTIANTLTFPAASIFKPNLPIGKPFLGTVPQIVSRSEADTLSDMVPKRSIKATPSIP